ncbi:MAG: hypothetical protein K0R67_3305 [Paenibacillus sp.]|jgi:hypothetical protein|nr:hypothetical protein [Paenibacillus sp.]
MVDAGSIVLFTIISFSLAVILIMKKDTIPPQLKRFMAITAIVLVTCSFFLIFYSLMSTFSTD